ncbi:glycerate kinase [Uranotaenia lowii]|uniref:glycerate kinase n=1 Tax=Uranotaenia lowii TaxID=190385 RepID=UPI002478952D|nr:glycerate kinase [Uranotaenia lowii]
MDQRMELLRSLFLKSVESVRPRALFTNYLLRNPSVKEHLSHTNKRYHVVGFGKAVLGIAVEMERVLGDRLVGGFLNVPVGTLDRFQADEEFRLSSSSRLKVFECARNNLPDSEAVEAARKIKSLAESMTADDVLCVLVSGGGSALLPLPISPIMLEEKLSVIKMLVTAGASIDELNTIRIQLSEVKGGKLALAAKESHRLMSFIISDIVGDPIPLIASGPTVKSNVSNLDARKILEKYQLADQIPKSVEQVLSESETPIGDVPGDIHLIGNNKVAFESILQKAKELNIFTIPLTTTAQGNVQDLCQTYINLVQQIVDFQSSSLKKSVQLDQFTLDPGEDVLVIAAGEPTVILQGSGLGGRNQELALRFSHEADRVGLKDVVFLSAGTDGIDGPTDAAGAFGGSFVLQDFRKTNPGKDAYDFVRDNDSYRFYTALRDGKYHIITGHTGTNVMDIHLIYVPRRHQ